MVTKIERAHFCVLEEPYAVWGADLATENMRFLNGIDTDLYNRIANMLVLSEDMGIHNKNYRKDISTISRLLWHHGIEALTMLLGAYVQAPHAVHSYFLKCKTEQVIEIGRMLLCPKKPKYSHIDGDNFSLELLIQSIYHYSGYDNIGDICKKNGRFPN